MKHLWCRNRELRIPIAWMVAGLWVGCVSDQRADATSLMDSVRVTSPSAPMVVMDYDRDGRTDLVMARQGGLWWRRDVAQSESAWAPLP
ncbi:MAG: hypothetical protein JNK85_05320, partial [Verrucomicrobiales bacterium]|nr:hypothetical protein [Verrucomicrobiales bacterium]